jgi:hypothetical protein
VAWLLKQLDTDSSLCTFVHEGVIKSVKI